MRILYMGNNLVGFKVLKYLKEKGENIVGVVVHPDEKAKYREEILQVAQVGVENTFWGNELDDDSIVARIKALKPDIILSVLFDYILKRNIIEIPPMGCINLHPAYLPFNKGQYPNVWSIVEETPAGATLHYIDEGIDTGDIISQKEVTKDFSDTGESLYHKLEDACFELFTETWDSIKTGENDRRKQPKGGTYHKTGDVQAIDKIELDKKYRAKDLLNILRARTFPPYESAYVELEDGRKVYIRVSLEVAARPKHSPVDSSRTIESNAR